MDRDMDEDGYTVHSHLPYYDLIKDEHRKEFQHVCNGLSYAVQVGELKPGGVFWVQRLSEFLVVHKRNIPVNEIVVLVKLLYKLVTIPGLEYNLQERFARVLTRLICKEKSLPSDALELEWRPLYSILQDVYFGSSQSTAYVHRDRHGLAIVKLIESSRRFFSAKATSEILDEFTPKLCPHDLVLYDAQGYLCLFLPTEYREGGEPHYELWLDWMFEIWGWVREDVHMWNGQWLRLLARLVKKQNTHKVHEALAPHLGFLFNKLLSALCLPVGNGGTPKEHRPPVSAGCQVLLLPDGETPNSVQRLCTIVVGMLSPQGTAMKHLSALMRATESFYHPSNSGAWTGRLAQLLYCLCSEFSDRLKLENDPNCHTPLDLRLGMNEREAFTSCLLPVMVPALFSKSHNMVMTSALSYKLLAYICPHKALPQLLEHVYPALETLTETHQTLAVLGCLSFVARPLLSMDNYPEGAAHLSTLLMLSLPGIDPNDPIKTETTLKFYCSVLACVRIQDISSPVYTNGLTDAQRQICETTALFETWALEFLLLLFEVCSHHSAPAKQSRKTMTAQVEANFSHSLRTTCHLFFAQLSPEILDECMERVFRYVTSSLVLKAKKPIGYICEALSSAAPEIVLQKFLPFITDRISDSLRGSLPDDEDADKELLWDMHMVAKLIKSAGPALLPHADALMTVVRDTIESPIKSVTKASCKLLKSLLYSLSAEYPLDWRSYTPVNDRNGEEHEGINGWGAKADYNNHNMHWHTPTDTELSLTNEILLEILLPAMDRLRALARHDTHVRNKEEGIGTDIGISRTQADTPPSHIEVNIRLALWRDLHIVRASKAGADSYLASSPVQTRLEEDSASLSISESESVNVPSEHELTIKKTNEYMHVDADSSMDDIRHGDTVGEYYTNESSGASLVPMVRKKTLTRTPSNVSPPRQVSTIVLQTLMVELCERMLYTHVDDAKILALLTKTLSCVATNDIKLPSVLYEKKRMYQATKVACGHPFERRSHTRLLLSTRAHLLYLARRGRDRSSIKYTRLHYHMLHCLTLLSTSRYIRVRKVAQSAFNTAARYYPRAKYDIYPVLLETLANPRSPIKRINYNSNSTREKAMPATSTTPSPKSNALPLSTHAESHKSIHKDAYTTTAAATSPSLDDVQHDVTIDENTARSGSKKNMDVHSDTDGVIKGGTSLLHSRMFGRLMTRDFDRMGEGLTAMCGAQSEDKRSIQSMISKLFLLFSVQYSTLSLKVTIPPDCREAAVLIKTDSPLSDEQIAVGLAAMQSKAKKTLESYRTLLRNLVELLRGGELHWRYEFMISSCLVMLLRADESPPKEAVDWFLDGCVSEILSLRRISMKALEVILACQRHKVSNKHWGVFSVDPRLSRKSRIYHPDNVPSCEEDYQSTIFVDKNWAGWQKSTFKVPYYIGTVGPYSGRRTDAELAIRNRFLDSVYVEKFIAMLDQEPPSEGMEHVQGMSPVSSMFSEAHANVYKTLFREHGKVVFDVFESHIVRLCKAGTKHSNWTAAEIIAGAARGSKHWSYEHGQQLWAFVVPLLREVFADLPNESVMDWVLSVQYWTYDRDPKRIAPLLAMMYENPLSSADSLSAISVARRVNFYRDSLTQLSWRGEVASLALLDYLKEHLEYPYKLVRDNIARCLLIVFSSVFITPENDREADSTTSSDCQRPCVAYGDIHPMLQTFVSTQVQQILQDMAKDAEEKSVDLSATQALGEVDAPVDIVTNLPMGMASVSSGSGAMLEIPIVNTGLESPSIEETFSGALQRGKTVLTWLTLQFHSGCIVSIMGSMPQILPMLLTLLDAGQDEKLTNLAKSCVHYIAHTVYPVYNLQIVLEVLCELPSRLKWRGRLSVVHILQSMVFRNLFHVSGPMLGKVTHLLHDVLLVDPQVEVRSAAAVTIGGLLRCDERMEIKKLNAIFADMARSPLPRRNKASNMSVSSSSGVGVRSKEFIRRHGGVLGLSACILAFPYNLPEFVPDLLCELSDHIADPEPIRSTVKSTLSDFRRTHQDNWHTLKSQFTDDQLSVLTDMLVSPSYYA
eukprot:CFRG7713T1